MLPSLAPLAIQAGFGESGGLQSIFWPGGSDNYYLMSHFYAPVVKSDDCSHALEGNSGSYNAFYNDFADCCETNKGQASCKDYWFPDDPCYKQLTQVYGAVDRERVFRTPEYNWDHQNWAIPYNSDELLYCCAINDCQWFDDPERLPCKSRYCVPQRRPEENTLPRDPSEYGLDDLDRYIVAELFWLNWGAAITALAVIVAIIVILLLCRYCHRCPLKQHVLQRKHMKSMQKYEQGGTPIRSFDDEQNFQRGSFARVKVSSDESSSSDSTTIGVVTCAFNITDDSSRDWDVNTEDGNITWKPGSYLLAFEASESIQYRTQ